MMSAASLWRKLNKARVLATKPTWRRGLLRGVAAAAEHDPIVQYVRPLTVIDVGANKGQFTLFAREAWPNCAIFAFEPLHAPAARFRAVMAGQKQIKLFEAAIAPEMGLLPFHVAAREDSSSFLPVSEDLQNIFPEVGEQKQAIDVFAAPLAHFVGAEDIIRPALLKIDAQGFEYQVITACRSIIDQIDAICVECSYLELYRGQALIDEVSALIGKLGFSRVLEYNIMAKPDAGKVQSDSLFVRASSKSVSENAFPVPGGRDA